MKFMRWILFATGIAVVVLRGFFPTIFQLDWYSVVILLILSVPILAPYLRKAKLPGTELEFKDEIMQTKKLVEISVEKAKQAPQRPQSIKALPFETFKLTPVRELLTSDPTLALAALQIEIERRLRTLVLKLTGNNTGNLTPLLLIDLVRRFKILSLEQVSALQKIVRMCKRAIHGDSVSKAQAKEIINLAEQLNRSFPTGYSIDLSPNVEYEQNGLICEWEHCIELMPLSDERTGLSCQVFGHNCPGGLTTRSSCTKTISGALQQQHRFTQK
ncbi:MAG: hypothetical protein AB1597_04360 [Chloroflexota bacterium]